MPKATPIEIFVIDGYNLVHKSSVLKKIIDEDLSIAREKLILQLDNFFSSKRASVYVVFDGNSNLTYLNSYSTPNIRVLFSKKSQKADILIKKIIDESKNKSLITVISSDHEVYQYAKVSRCKAIKSEEFLNRMKTYNIDFENKIKNHNLTEDEINFWKNIFNAKE